MKEKTSQEIKFKAENDKKKKNKSGNKGKKTKKKKKKKKCLALIVHDLGDHSNFLDLQK